MVVLAQLAEHRIVVPSVVGSSPTFHPNRCNTISYGGFLCSFFDKACQIPANKSKNHLCIVNIQVIIQKQIKRCKSATCNVLFEINYFKFLKRFRVPLFLHTILAYFVPLKIPLSVSSLSIRFQPSLCLVPKSRLMLKLSIRRGKKENRGTH